MPEVPGSGPLRTPAALGRSGRAGAANEWRLRLRGFAWPPSCSDRILSAMSDPVTRLNAALEGGQMKRAVDAANP